MDELRLILIVAGVVVIGLIYLFSRRSQRDEAAPGEEPHIEDTEWMEEIARQRRKLAESRSQPVMDEGPADIPVLDDPRIPSPEPSPSAEIERGETGEGPGADEPRPEMQSREEAAGSDTSPLAESSIEPPAPESPEESEATEESPAAEATPDTDDNPPKELIMALHVTAPPEMVFVGANLFSALEEAGLRFGEGGIFHYYQTLEEGEQGPVVFSVANILEPGTFEPTDPGETFTTPGIVMFMRAPGPLPARKAIETMLLKSQQLAQSLGGEIRDERRDPLTEATLQSLLDRATAFDQAMKHAAD